MIIHLFDPMQLRLELRRAGVRTIDIASRAGVRPCLVSNVIAGRARSARTEAAIAAAIGKAPAEVFRPPAYRQVRSADAALN